MAAAHAAAVAGVNPNSLIILCSHFFAQAADQEHATTFFNSSLADHLWLHHIASAMQTTAISFLFCVKILFLLGAASWYARSAMHPVCSHCCFL